MKLVAAALARDSKLLRAALIASNVICCGVLYVLTGGDAREASYDLAPDWLRTALRRRFVQH